LTVQFVDTYYLLALVIPSDKDHLAAIEHSQGQT